MLPSDLKFDPNSDYETLKSRYVTLDYAPLNKVYLESVNKSTLIGHQQELFGAGLYGLLEWSSAELKEHGSPTKTDEEANYQTLPWLKLYLPNQSVLVRGELFWFIDLLFYHQLQMQCSLFHIYCVYLFWRFTVYSGKWTLLWFWVDISILFYDLFL